MTENSATEQINLHYVKVINLPYDTTQDKFEHLVQEKAGNLYEQMSTYIFKDDDGNCSCGIIECKSKEDANKAANALDQLKLIYKAKKKTNAIVFLDESWVLMKQMEEAKRLPFETYGIDERILKKLGLHGRRLHRVLVIHNLPFKMDCDDLIRYFRMAFGIIDAYVPGRIVESSTKQGGTKKFVNFGRGYLEFKHVAFAVDAFGMYRNASFHQRKIIIKMETTDHTVEHIRQQLPRAVKDVQKSELSENGRALNDTDLYDGVLKTADMSSETADIDDITESAGPSSETAHMDDDGTHSVDQNLEMADSDNHSRNFPNDNSEMVDINACAQFGE